MKPISTIYKLIFIFVLCTGNSFSQQMNPEKIDPLIVESVKEDIWIPFMESYRDLDNEKFASVYTQDVTRVSIDLNKIELGAEYFDNINSFFEQIKNMDLQMDITFSIVSSATTENKVFQTGYYTIDLKNNENKPLQSTGYSYFEVMLIKDGSWKISLDTDKKTTLTEEEFLKSGTIYKLE